MNASDLTACWNAIPPGKRDAPEHIDRRLARQAVRSNALTLWQAQQLLAGRTAGYKIDRYILLELIGQGGMGRVYLGRDTRLNRRVALKILSPERMKNPRAIARFHREARVGAQLQHENLVRIYDFGEFNGRYYLVMEYIEGKTIGTMLAEQGPMPPSTAVRLARQVALGLEHAHRKGLIHRDVNPYNILVTHDGYAKLADLGLALDLADEDRVTREGATVGTFDYVAPEQARQSHAADIRSDIYSLGCSLYHMIACQVPFPTPSLPEKLFAHQALEPKPLEQLVSGLPQGLADVVRRMMCKRPEDRYDTPLQVAQALEPYEETFTRAPSGDELQPTRASAGAVEQSTDAAQSGTPTVSATVKTVDLTVGLKNRPGEEADVASTVAGRTSRAEPTPHSLAPIHDAESSDSDFQVLVDLGPEPFLSEGLSRPKSRLASVFASRSGVLSAKGAQTEDSRQSPAHRSAPVSRRLQLGLWGLLALCVIVTVLVAVLATDRFLNGTSAEPGGQGHLTPGVAQKPSTSPGGKAAARPRLPVTKARAAIVVRTMGDIEREEPADSLQDAMRTAISTRGSWVELRNPVPLHLGAGQSFDFTSGRGDLIIRAAPTVIPVIEVELKGSKPLLATGSGMSLELSGLTIVAHVSDAETSSSASPVLPPVVKSAGKAKIDRCAFRLANDTNVRGSSAVFSDGGALVVDRCWFEGFDKAIEVSALRETTTRIGQTMIVCPLGRFQAQRRDLYGWGVKLRLDAHAKGDTLSLEHCTVEGAGLLELDDSAATKPAGIAVKHCALRTEALLAWRPKTPKALLAEKLHWVGEGNQFQVPRRSWIVLSASQDTPALSSAVTDLESWSKVAKETAPFRTELEYKTPPAERSSSLLPRDFGVKTSDPGRSTPGADPDLVGPWSKL